jgi:hypothetical protein
MRYNEIRDQIKTGDLLAFSNGSWTSWHDAQVNIVRMATRSEYSHVGIAWVISGRIFVLEAVGTGIRIFPLSKCLPAYLIKRSKPLSDGALEYAISLVGEKYSKFQAVKAFFNQLKVGADKEWQCAEYVSSVYYKDGEEVVSSPTPSNLVFELSEKWASPIYYISS